jgi:hypothetical protein
VLAGIAQQQHQQAESQRASDEQRRSELHEWKPERTRGDAGQLRREWRDRAAEHQEPAVAIEQRFARRDARAADAQRAEQGASEIVERVHADEIRDASPEHGAGEGPCRQARRARRIGERQRGKHHSARSGHDRALKQLPCGRRGARPSGFGPTVQCGDET